MGKYGICRVEKYTAGDVTGIQKHDRREAIESKSNPDIDYKRTYLNYDLSKQDNSESFRKKVKNIINRLNLKRKLRNDANVMCQLMCTASPEFFEGKSPEEIREYFVECYNFLSKKYGKDNIVSAIVHMDEKTPHMHFNFVPVTKDKRVSSRDLFSPTSLTELQTQMHLEVFSKYGLDRGETKKDKRRHYTTQVYKAITIQKEIDEKTRILATLSNEQVFEMRKHIDALSCRLDEMMNIILSNEELKREYLKARDLYYAEKKKEEREI